MTPKFLLVTIFWFLCYLSVAQADEFSYEAVAKRFGETQLDAKRVQEAKMHGECLVGLKHLIFVKRDDFDPVAEWINYRTISLLEQFPPCNVLIMMEVAREELIEGDSQS
jgi:hypothetical protein